VKGESTKGHRGTMLLYLIINRGGLVREKKGEEKGRFRSGESGKEGRC